MMFVYCGQEWPLLDGIRMINIELYVNWQYMLSI